MLVPAPSMQISVNYIKPHAILKLIHLLPKKIPLARGFSKKNPKPIKGASLGGGGGKPKDMSRGGAAAAQ